MARLQTALVPSLASYFFPSGLVMSSVALFEKHEVDAAGSSLAMMAEAASATAGADVHQGQWRVFCGWVRMYHACMHACRPAGLSAGRGLLIAWGDLWPRSFTHARTHHYYFLASCLHPTSFGAAAAVLRPGCGPQLGARIRSYGIMHCLRCHIDCHPDDLASLMMGLAHLPDDCS